MQLELPNRPHLRRIAITVAAAFLTTTQASSADAQTAPTLQPPTVVAPYARHNQRGRLVTYKHIRRMSRRQIRDALFNLPFLDTYGSFGLEDFFDFYSPADIDRVTHFGIDVYQVVYETVDPFGVPTTASGAALVPRGRRHRPLPTPALVGLHRGTVFYDDDVPSHGNMPDWGIWRGLLPASAGYVTAMPDYLGFGAGRHIEHTYNMARPTAVASVDMLRATRHLAEAIGQPLRDEVFLMGHSQGGQATLATHREIEALHAGEFQLAGSVPSSAAYVLSGVADAIFKSETLIAPQVSTLLLLAIDEIYGLNRGPSYYFRPPYDSLVPELHDKTKNNLEIISALPTGRTDTLFTDQFLAGYRGDGEVALKAALLDNNVHTGWTPVAPVRLVHGAEDSILPPVQGQAALGGLSGPGADVDLTIVPDAEHLQTIVPSTLIAIDWFERWLGRR